MYRFNHNAKVSPDKKHDNGVEGQELQDPGTVESMQINHIYINLYINTSICNALHYKQFRRWGI